MKRLSRWLLAAAVMVLAAVAGWLVFAGYHASRPPTEIGEVLIVTNRQLTVIEGMQTVDVSGLGRYHPTGHEYFFYHPVVAADLVDSLVLGKPPAERTHTRGRSRDGLVYWVLDRAEASR